MEIISFVQDKPRSRGFNLPVIKHQKKTKVAARSFSSSLMYTSFSPELRSFSAQKVKQGISLRVILRGLGIAGETTGKFIVSNVKFFLITVVALCALSVAGFYGLKAYNYTSSHTGPLALEEGITLDIENLNKLMASFALEGIAEYDESGNLLDSSAVSAQSFKQPVSYQTYKVRSGDTISGIAKKFGLRNISTLISVNDIGNVRQLCAGQKLRIPSIDGVVYTVKAGDSIESIATKNKVSISELLDVNDIESEVLSAGQQLFLPGVGLDSATLKNAMGDLFMMPIQAKFRWSSPYGNRIDPIANVKSFHTGTDMACPTGTPILASMSGKVSAAGINRVYGNYVIIDHGNGYQTLYAHMSKIIATKGQWVSQGTRIGLVGSTGYSTGPHLHFTVYKNGKLVDPMSVLKR